MEQEQIAHFKAVYRGLSEWDIEDLDSRKNGLTDEAQAALSEIIAERQVDVAGMRKEVIDESKALVRQAEEKEEKQRVKDRKVIKVLSVATIPIILILFLIRPERTYQTLISTIVQAVVLAAISGGIYAWRRKK
jgi:hypothetical protein